jgi:REP element-mobilizing transposase RayT
MPVDVLFFITWKTTRNWRLLTPECGDYLLALLPRLAMLERCEILELVIIPTHIHVVVRTTHHPDIPKLVQRLKGASSRLVNRDVPLDRRLRWDIGYDVRSVSRLSLPVLRAYFDRQARKHAFTWQRRLSRAPGAPPPHRRH